MLVVFARSRSSFDAYPRRWALVDLSPHLHAAAAPKPEIDSAARLQVQSAIVVGRNGAQRVDQNQPAFTRPQQRRGEGEEVGEKGVEVTHLQHDQKDARWS